MTKSRKSDNVRPRFFS